VNSTDRHYRALEALYARAPINGLFPSRLTIVSEGQARITFEVAEELFHGAGAAHGTIYFKMLDDAAFYAANSLVTDVFMLTTAFNMLLTRPVGAGPLVAEGRWLSGHRRMLIAESRLIDSDEQEVGRATGTFMRSAKQLASLPGYADAIRAD
jgi:uncharacterized protein (TIGR00369 family)